jgi:hypothetical protein
MKFPLRSQLLWMASDSDFDFPDGHSGVDVDAGALVGPFPDFFAGKRAFDTKG